MQRRNFGRSARGRSRGGARPSRVWVGIQDQFSFASQAATGTAVLVQLQAPADLSNLTADPPEDLTVLRVIGDLTVTLASTSAGSWTLALLVQDTTWTPTTRFEDDADKRILWAQNYTSLAAATYVWTSGYLAVNNVPTPGVPREMTRLDIAPKVRIEAGKALYLVAYEQSGTTTFSVESQNMRLLFQRSGRPS